MIRRYEILIDPEKQDIAVKVVSFWSGERVIGEFSLLVDAFNAIIAQEQKERNE